VDVGGALFLSTVTTLGCRWALPWSTTTTPGCRWTRSLGAITTSKCEWVSRFWEKLMMFRTRDCAGHISAVCSAQVWLLCRKHYSAQHTCSYAINITVSNAHVENQLSCIGMGEGGLHIKPSKRRSKLNLFEVVRKLIVGENFWILIWTTQQK
jgi:hypothetical protein